MALDLSLQAVEQVKREYFAMDYVAGEADAARFLRRFPQSRELAAWHVANLARLERPVEARREADALLKANRNDPWGWFARTLILEYASEGNNAPAALQASLEAYRRAPTNTTIQWLRALALMNSAQAVQAMSMIDSLGQRRALSSEMLVLRANAFLAAGPARRADPARVDSGLALFARARQSDSLNVAAYTGAAARLITAGRPAEAYALAKRALALSPLAVQVHEIYWRAIDALRDRSQAARDSEIVGDVEALLRARGGEATVLNAAANQYRTHNRLEAARVLEERILAEHGRSYTAEWVLVERYRALDKLRRDTTTRDASLTERYRQAVWQFVDRRPHISDRMLGDAYRTLYELADSTTNADTLLTIVQGMVKYEGINPHITYAQGAIRLAESGRHLKEAEQIARDGLKAGKAKVDEQKATFETIGDYARTLDWMAAFMYDALGVVFSHEKRFDDAQRELEHARDLDPRNAQVTLHLGNLAERRGRLDDAEQWYIKGALLPAFGTKNLNAEALKRVYAVKRGSLAGYDAFFANLAEIDRANRKTAIAKTRATNPELLKGFALPTLDGRLVTLDSLRGKTAVINNWGMWCGPCVLEMPEYQTLAKQFATDSTVRILTIDNDKNTDELRAWMQKKGYTFTTLLDDGYLGRSSVHEFPTTWFLDGAGRIVFTKVGWSEKLAEEFAWRIEMIRQGTVTP